MKPLLAHKYEPSRIQYPCYIQPKLNGIRALYKAGHFQSRDEQPFPPGLLDHLATPLQNIFDTDTVLDGELYVHGWPLQRINGAVTPIRQQPNEDTVQVEYWIFDRVDHGQPFEKRFKDIDDVKADLIGTQINLVTTTSAPNEVFADKFYSWVVQEGFEGIMYRIGDCPYTLPKQPTSTISTGRLRFLSDKNNRTWHLLKRKDWQDDEFPCVGVEEGEGKYKEQVGALVCVTPTGQRFRVGSGLSDRQRQIYFEHPELVLGKQIKVKYLVLSELQIPLNPTILLIP